MAPLADPLERLARGRHGLIHDNVRPYFRDVHDHLLRMLGHISTYRDILTSALTANLTQVTVRQNEDMRRIAACAALFAAPTLVVGLYGMNFKDMPELSLELRLPVRARADDGHRRAAVPLLPPRRLALSPQMVDAAAGAAFRALNGRFGGRAAAQRRRGCMGKPPRGRARARRPRGRDGQAAS